MHHGVFERSAIGFCRKRAQPCGEMKQHRAERIHVTRSHGRLAENLLRRGILERQTAPG